MGRCEVAMDIIAGSIKRNSDTNFWDKVDKTGSCWNWKGAKYRGYGQFTIEWWKREDGKWRCRTVRAHRYAYESLVGEIPEGLTLDHLCYNVGCANPDHLEPVTITENRRRASAKKTHCVNGHPLSGENLVRRKNRKARECKTCANARRRIL